MMIEEPLYPIMNMHNWERELFQTKSVRRLKHLAHFGAGSYISPVVHSRFEHTVGVWKLAAHFFPEDSLIRAAAILHDIGHVPFSHSVERALGYNHHDITNQLIQEEAISTILQDAGLSSGEVCRYLNQSTPLTGVDGVMGIDHLDSFLRDTYMNGKAHFMPRNVLLQLDCNERGITTDIETAEYLVELAYKDHVHFLSPKMVGVDRLLAEAVYREEKNDPKLRHVFPRLNDREVLARLKKSSDSDVLNISFVKLN
jgi:hypothetical protein